MKRGDEADIGLARGGKCAMRRCPTAGVQDVDILALDQTGPTKLRRQRDLDLGRDPLNDLRRAPLLIIVDLAKDA